MGLFHAKMAGARLALYEHWGKYASRTAGGLWWENARLNRKNISAGWQSKSKAAPWHTTHELLQISAAAHVHDAFSIHHPGDLPFKEWASAASMSDVANLATTVYHQLFSTAAYVEAAKKDTLDHTFMNSILYNRDVLIYLEFCDSIKKGDIGRVLNVLRVWMLMMRAPKTMPRYADLTFETVSMLERLPEHPK